MSDLFLEQARAALFVSSFPLTFTWGMISSMVTLAKNGEVANDFLVVSLATHKILVIVDAVVGHELLATTLAEKHIATVLPYFVLLRCWKRFDSLVTDITMVNPLSLCCALSPHTDPTT